MGSQYAFPVDVWSLGVLAFMLLSGCAPFDTSDAQLEERQVCTAAAQPLTAYHLLPTTLPLTARHAHVPARAARATSPYLPLWMAMVAHGSTYSRQVCMGSWSFEHANWQAGSALTLTLTVTLS